MKKTTCSARRIAHLWRIAFLLTLACFLASFANKAQAQEKTLLNVDKKGVAIQGYDPVTFFTKRNPIHGDAKFTSSYHGATYLFASAEDKAKFDKDPAKYEPQFGGYCAYGVTKGKAVEVEIDAFQIVGGRLLLQYDKGIRDKFAKDPESSLKLADQKWPEVVKAYGK